jgi:hypothetical protein
VVGVVEIVFVPAPDGGARFLGDEVEPVALRAEVGEVGTVFTVDREDLALNAGCFEALHDGVK